LMRLFPFRNPPTSRYEVHSFLFLLVRLIETSVVVNKARDQR
jgi:hypothetical protein